VAEGRQRNRGFFSDLVRRVSNAREGSKILSFPFRPRLVCSSLLHLRSSQNLPSASFVLTAFSEVQRSLWYARAGAPPSGAGGLSRVSLSRPRRSRP
jgi:hypothetical protein